MLETNQEDDLKIKYNFWSSDESALNILLNRLSQAKQTFSTVLHFLQQRVQIEQEYGNRLYKLSQSILESPFDVLLSTTEITARTHIELSQNISEMLEIPWMHHLKQQQASRHAIKHQIKNVQNMKTTYDRHLKKAYHAYIAACQSSTDPIDISILDQEYQIAVDLSQSSHWTHHWETSLDDIQSLETNRLQILKSIVNTLAHMLTYTCSNDEQACQRMMSTMEDLDVNESMNQFIREHGTGKIKPVIPNYTQYKETRRVSKAEKDDDGPNPLQPPPHPMKQESRQDTRLLQYPLQPRYPSDSALEDWYSKSRKRSSPDDPNLV
ncbi:hypothetical protein G6F57_001330 [Rhizopus arrhizus]|uniref:FCH domain-containing protein n=1 Tax=Rhizopus oryzae TaxID=64495 RepID=A0A9P6XIH9_RHIOR|nr:hypothetical protein G6F24_001300 [Rhizopus arrhizus]KAG1413006.1 hypothetical protein G6F58_007718 [Rhizopus delemar]KAG0796144.1 hypothetical protein G6F21_001542 [Rhizopus arrhizus]KAG0816300.1 hypothetical protein G6F20_003310 [Rhizopus arrhizus]KAG0840248.1 hypothetical protein G6F19_002140 [Rhizopus arrhizus]